MKRLILTLCTALSLSACTIPNISVGSDALPAAPAPLANTVVDDKALQAAWASFDLALDGIIILRDTGYLKRGTPKAIAVANGIDKVTAILNLAEAAVAAGSTKDYAVAMSQLKGATTSLRAILKGN